MAFPWMAIGGALSVGKDIFNSIWPNTRAGYVNSPAYRAFQDSVKQEQRIFERDSAYNSPQAQMERLKAAGLNPNLMYGQGTLGNVQGSAVQSRGDVPTSSIDALSQMLSVMMAKKDIELKDAQIDNLYMRTGSEQVKQEKMRQDIQYLQQQYPELINKLRRENIIGDRTMEAQVDIKEAEALRAYSLYATELQRQGLMERDGKIKDEVLKSKQFENAIAELNKRLLADKEFSADTLGTVLIQLLLNRR